MQRERMRQRWAEQREELRALKRGKPHRPYREARKLHPEQFQARIALQGAVRHGRIVKPSRCQECRTELPSAKLQGHHHDYSKPLDVEWLCQACHMRRHRVDERPA